MDNAFAPMRPAPRGSAALGAAAVALLLHAAVLALLLRFPLEAAVDAAPYPLEISVAAAIPSPGTAAKKERARAEEPPPAAMEEALPAPAAVPVAAAPAASSAVADDAAPSAPTYRAAYLNNPAPAYPLEAKRRGMQGIVLIRAFISAAGEPLRAEVARSSGFAALDNAALRAVERWMFVPARRDGQAVAAAVEIPFNFKLE